ncbi:hypothetical protein HDU88_007144 [Geranomyces variabilis]|nr:hypothetical protein HDU88_007144 [Geranomyces variabilis]
MSAFGGLASTLGGRPAQTPDREIQQGPGDTVSELRFSPTANFLAASSWDNQTRIWEVNERLESSPKAVIQHEGPVLSVEWSRDGSKVVSAGCDKAARLLDLATGQSQQVAGHDAPIRCCRFVEGPGNQPLLVTGSWDKTMKYWDMRQQTPAHTVPLPERCYVMDTYGPMLVVGTADKQFSIFSNANLAAPMKVIPSPMKFQVRSVACAPSTNPSDMGFTFGTIEGRIQIQYLEDKTPGRSFSFKCHRENKATQEVFAVNSLAYHPHYGTFASGGSDGGVNFWDGNSKQRLKNFNSPIPGQITAVAFNGNGSIFAYAAGYDWSKGHEHAKPDQKTGIYLQAVQVDDVKPKPPAAAKAKRY